MSIICKDIIHARRLVKRFTASLFCYIENQAQFKEIESMTTVETCLTDALEVISNFIAETTGQAATPEEVAHALTRYFVLQEIKGHIEMVRQEK
jgi:hypothetical protein